MVVVGVQQIEHEGQNLLSIECVKVDKSNDELLEANFVGQLFINKLKKAIGERSDDRVIAFAQI